VAFNILAGRVSAPVLRLAQIWQDFHQARLSVARLGDILNTVAEPTYTAARAAAAGDPRQHQVRPCRFRIPHRRTGNPARCLLRRAGRQTVGIVGPSGSGKSTFAKLVQRLYVPESGRVLIDGMDLAWRTRPWLRRQIGVVLQENVLFIARCARTSRSPTRRMPMERIIAAASLAGGTTSSSS